MTDNRHLEVEVDSSKQALQQALKQQQQQQEQPDPAELLSLQEQEELLGALQQQEAALQESHLQASYEQAMAGHLNCLLQQVRDTAEAAAAAQEGATEGRCGAALAADHAQLQGGSAPHH
jgi:hypothetical protein